jgi:hypothetical protein
MSEVKVNKITPTTDCGTVTLGDSGDTVAIPAGVNLTSGGALTNSGTITNTGSITGVAITGTIDNQVNWQTTVKTTGFTAVAGEGYFCDTTSAAFTVTLPASPSAGDLVGIKDYANTADTNNITIGRNGSNIEGVANDFVIEVEGGSITLIYVDATKGWLSTAAAKSSDITEQTLFLTATGGTITTSGDFKIHTFTGPGTFCVSCAGNSIGNDKLSYLVIAGGAAGGNLGGGGAGGFRESKASTDSYTASPLNATSGPTYNLTVTAQGYPITVGAGGAGSGFPYGANGSNSIFSTITSTGGGGGAPGPFDTVRNGKPGGSAGGGHGTCSGPGVGGTGNTPPVSPPQGNNGGDAGNVPGIASVAGGGGGAGAVGASASGAPSKVSANGGNGVATSITNSSVTRAGGGGGGLYILFGGCGPTDGTKGTGGSGGGGNGGGNTPPATPNATSATTNTGSGGGGAGLGNCGTGIISGSGGSGIVVIRYKFQ